MGIGCASGTNRAMVAVQKAVNNAVLGTSIEGASRVIINVEGREIKMDEVSRAVEVVRGVCAKGANIIFGTAIVPELQDSIQVTIIATGFNTRPAAQYAEEHPQAQPAPQPIFPPQPTTIQQTAPQPQPTTAVQRTQSDNGRISLDDSESISWWQKLNKKHRK